MAQQQRGPGPRTQITRGALIAATLAAAVAFFFGGPVASAGVLNTFFVTFATTYALGMYSAREQAKAAEQEAQERRETIRSAVSPRRVIYGEVQTGGTLVYAQVTGPERNFLHMIIALAGHEVDSIGDIYFDEKFLGEIDPVTGFTVNGPYAGLVRVKKYLGTANQTADPNLVAESGGRWTANHRLRGIAYIYVRLQWDQDKFLGIPNIRAQVRGRRVFDPRDNQVRFTLNPALHLRDYFTNSSYGLNCSSGEIDDTTVVAAANTCDQWVELDSSVELDIRVTGGLDAAFDNIYTQGGLDARVSTGDRCRFRVIEGVTPGGLVADGTYYLIRRGVETYQLASTYDNAINGIAVDITSVPPHTPSEEDEDGYTNRYKLDTFAQHRYQSNGTFTLDTQPAAIEEPIRLTMAGYTVYSEGRWRIYAGAYSAPGETITADELRGDISIRPRRPRRELVNQVRGTYVDPARNWVATDFPPYTNLTYVAEDGGEVISRSIDLSWVINPYQAQRVAKITMNRNRAVQMTLPCKISALRVAAAETINVTIDQLGYENEVFRVVGWKLNGEDGGIGVDLSLESDNPEVYDWASTDATDPPTLVSVDIPDPRVVASPENLQLFSGNDELFLGSDGTVVSRIRAAWLAPAALNISGYEVAWRRSVEDTYTNSVTVDGRQLSYTIAPVQDGVNYDVRVRTVNSFGAKSEWSEIANYAVIGKTAPPPAPTSLTVSPAINGFDIVWSSSGVADYAYSLLLENTTNNSATATAIARVAGNRFARAGLPGNVSRWYWVRHVDTSGNQSTIFPAATSGITAVTLAGEGGVPTVANAAAITGAIGTEPPGGSNYWAVFDNTTGRIWAWQTSTGTYSKAVDAADIAGTLADAQIASLAASKITGQLTDAQVANVAAAKLIGQVVSTQIANVANTAIIGNIVSSQIANITGGQVIGNLTNANIPNANIIGQLVASQIANVANTAIIGNIVSSQITSVLGNQVIGNLTNANIPNANIIGQLVSSQIASVANTAIVGTLTDSQLANIAATKLIGNIVASQIANVANTAIIGNIVSSQIANITGGQVIGNLTNANIPNANIIGQLVSSQIANVANTAIIGNIVDSQLSTITASKVLGNLTAANIPNTAIIGQLVASQIANVANTAIIGNIVASQIANITGGQVIGNLTAANIPNANIIGQLVASQIANVANTAIIGQLVASQIANVANTAIIGNIVDSQLASITASKVVGNLTAANIPNANIIGQLVASQIANVANTAIVGTLTDSQLANIAAAKLTGQITTTQITDNAITTPKIAANAVVANTIAAGAIVAEKIATGAVTANAIAAGAVVANAIAANAVTANAILAGSVTTAKIAANAVTANEIAAGTITGNKIAANTIAGSSIIAGDITATQIQAGAIGVDQIAANAVVAGKIAANAVVAVSIAANAVTSDKIVTNTINASHIVSGAITSDKIAANAVVANAIAAGVITSDKIAANTIAGDRLLANTITAAQIATGAITADELAANSVTATAILANAVTTAKLAAGSVTTNKLVVVGNAEALNDDPNTQDITAWSTTPANSATITTDTTAPSGNQVLRVSATGPTVISARAIPIDPSKNYQLRLWTRSSTGSTTTYLTVAFYDVNGALISGGATGWLSQGTFHYWGLAAQTVPSTWTEYRVSFGGTEPITMPAGARFVRVGFLGNWAGTGVQDVTGIKLILKSDADLIVDGAIVAAKIAANAIVAGKIAASSITSTEIAANAIGATQIAANAVTADKILANAVTAGKIAANAVTANEIAAGTITGDKIAANTIGADRLVANSITANQIATGAITADELAVNSVTANAIAAGSVTTAKIAANAVTANEILAGSITTAKIAANAVTANVIAAGAVGATQIAADAVTANAILAGSVTTAKIAANAVTANEIAASTITGSKIAANTILGSSIIAGNITATQIATGAITSDKIAANAVTANAILAGSVTAAAIAANAVTANAIAAATITGDKIAANTIGADRLVANSITATQIQAGAIGASQLAAGSVTANAIAANAVVAGDIAANAVTAETIAANAVTAVAIAAGTITGNKIAANTILGSSIVAGNITGDRIAANTITGNLIQAGSITADRLAVTSLSAITANLGSVNSGNFTTDTTGFIRSGTATWNSGTGFWMGYDATTYKFRVGDPTANQMSWDGTNLSVTGQITDRRQHGAGSNTFASADFPLFIGNAGTTAANLYKSIRVSRPGTITVYFELRAGGQSIAYGQIRRNGVAVGTLRSTPTGPVGQLGPVQSWSENITVSAGDLVQLYCSYSGTNTGVCKNFKLRTNLTIATDGVEQDDGGFNYAWGA